MPQNAAARRACGRARRRRTRGSLVLFLLLLACDTAGFKDSYTALDGQGDRKRTSFHTDTESIYCVVEMASGVSDVTVVAKVRALQLYDEFTGRPHGVDMIVGVEEQAPGAGPNITISFSILKPEGANFYPAGRFACELFLDGELESRLEFEVRYPACPFQPVEPETACAGLVLLGAECPSPLGGSCTCAKGSGIWECS
jgi:hypothetical protein